jgi:hypothetical protein
VTLRRLSALFAFVLCLVPLTMASASSASASGTSPTGTISLRRIDIPLQKGTVASSNPKTRTRAAETDTPFSCSAAISGLSGKPAYYTQSDELAHAVWAGGTSAECSVPMTSISVSLSAVDPEGTPHVLAANSCDECDSADAPSDRWTCQQSTQDCSGVWSITQDTTFVAPTDGTFNGGNGCVADGATSTCTFSEVLGLIWLFYPTVPTTCTDTTTATQARTADLHHRADTTLPCPNYPAGREPVLDLGGLDHIKDTHFADGERRRRYEEHLRPRNKTPGHRQQGRGADRLPLDTEHEGQVGSHDRLPRSRNNLQEFWEQTGGPGHRRGRGFRGLR